MRCSLPTAFAPLELNSAAQFVHKQQKSASEIITIAIMSDSEASEDDGVVPVRYSSGNTSATLSKSSISDVSKGKGKPMATVAVVREDNHGKQQDKRKLLIHPKSLAATIRNIISREIFARIKFVQTRELEWSNDATALCHRICEFCHINPADREVWWQAASRYVKRSIAETRAQKAGQIRVAFLCKYLGGQLGALDECLTHFGSS